MMNPEPGAEMREFLLVVRRALLLIVAHIERKYGLSSRRDERANGL